MVVDGEVIGAIGASFATPEEDEQVATAGLAGLREGDRSHCISQPLSADSRMPNTAICYGRHNPV